MKPHPRIRKTIKWGGAAVTVLLVVVWIGSGAVRAVGLRTAKGLAIYAGDGRLEASYSSDPSWIPGIEGTGWHAIPAKGLRWDARCGGTRTDWWVFVPTWIPMVMALAATTIAWRLDSLARRRERLGVCPKCHYDRTGIAKDVVCPECGASAA